MYSMVLMAAVATSGDVASFHKKSTGCNGCYGAPVVVRSAPMIYSVGCYGSAPIVGGCTGCWGCSGCTGYVPYSTSCYGCCGGSCIGSGWSCTGGSGCCGGIVIWSSPVIEAPAQPATTPAAEEKKKTSLEVELPAEATLFVDGRMVPGTGSVRSFTTPEISAGKPYYYDMKAEVTVDGKVIQEEHRVVVRGGETLKQSFGILIAKAKASTPTDIAKK